MNQFQVTHVTLAHPGTELQHIRELGAPNWRMTRETMYYRIMTGQERFYTVDPVTQSTVIIEAKMSLNGTLYVETAPDFTRRDNLLSLPGPCPESWTLIV